MHADVERLKLFLSDSGLVSREEFDAAAATAAARSIPVKDVLIADGKLSEDEYRKAEAYVLGIPFVTLREARIPKEVLMLIPEPIARRHNIIAYNKSAAGVEVAMLNPQDLIAIDFVRKGTGLKILARLTDTESIKQALLLYQKSLKAEFSDIISKEASNLSTVDESDAHELKKLAEDLPVVRIVDTLLTHAIAQKASDIHIEQYEHEVVVRYRIDGILHDAMTLPKTAGPGVVARIKVLSNLRLDEKRLPQDGRFKVEQAAGQTSIRVSLLPTSFGEKVVMRILPDVVQGYSLEVLGFHGEGLERLHQAMRKPIGMILVTGPTGSGKSTTLYTVLDMLNTPDVNISTIEDPVEYQMPRVNQTQVKPEIGMTFAAGLRALMRQDPDIIMVGEIRDSETANLAINAALTGHLVLSTLHTNSAAATVPRMLDMGAEAFLLVSTINVIIAQRLVRKLTKSKEQYFLTEAEAQSLTARIPLERVMAALVSEHIIPAPVPLTQLPFYRPVASPEHTEGFSGRIGIHEVMSLSQSVRELIMQGATAEAIEAQAVKEGMLTMFEDGIFKAAQGITTIEEVLRVASE